MISPESRQIGADLGCRVEGVVCAGTVGLAGVRGPTSGGVWGEAGGASELPIESQDIQRIKIQVYEGKKKGGHMDDRESILDLIHEEENMEDADDIEMLDVEDGEVVDGKSSHVKWGQHSEGGAKDVKSESLGKTRRRRKNKKRNRKNKDNNESGVTDINRYVLDVCRRLKEKKSYLVYTAVGCLGVSALSDIVKEVDAIQACGGQKTADGNRFRTGGGILWSILKAREPNAYKEIMKRGREFEKQFRQPGNRQAGGKNKETPSNSTRVVTKQTLLDGNLDGLLHPISPGQGQPEPESVPESQLNSEGKQISLDSRMRRPVSYDDLLVDEPESGADHLA
ncbi:hypothetical protein Dimus_002730 [Dionaea muscipula]